MSETVQSAPRRDKNFWSANYLNEGAITMARLENHPPLNNPKILVNVGSHLAAEARPYIDAGWRVFAFEPNPVLHDQLREMERAHENFTFLPKAVSDKPGEDLTFWVSDKSSGMSSLVKRDPDAREVKVEVTTLAAFCEEYGIEAIDFLLVDAELKDLEVVMSLGPSTRVGALCVEFGGNRLNALHGTITERWPQFDEIIWEYRKPLGEDGKEKMGVAAKCIARSSYEQYIEKVRTDAPRGRWGNIFYFDRRFVKKGR
ncbi:MAG: FkbM family methyltransferase [Alphaproteobacteria bacterium]|nr:FkbM family methyltransferase [Alphaproteobacteria bacterium]